jgi:hypothetical protein
MRYVRRPRNQALVIVNVDLLYLRYTTRCSYETAPSRRYLDSTPDRMCTLRATKARRRSRHSILRLYLIISHSAIYLCHSKVYVTQSNRSPPSSSSTVVSYNEVPKMSRMEEVPAAAPFRPPEDEEDEEDEEPLPLALAAVGGAVVLWLIRRLLRNPGVSTERRAAAPAGVPFRGGPLSSWSASAVAAFLVTLDLGVYAPAFLENGVDGALLEKLTTEDFLELGVERRLHRVRAGPSATAAVLTACPEKDQASRWPAARRGRRRGFARGAHTPAQSRRGHSWGLRARNAHPRGGCRAAPSPTASTAAAW